MKTLFLINGHDGKFTSFVTCLLLLVVLGSCQPSIQTVTKTVYITADHEKPKNIILLIGDGMGLTQISALHYKNKQKSCFVRFPVVGLQTCHSADNLITDSAASATAMASGVKTNNNMIGMDPLEVEHPTLLDIAKGNQMATGIVVTSNLTGATPAAFYAHQKNRGFNEQIAVDFLSSNIDLAIGGGYTHFAERTDKRNILKDLIKKSYIVHSFHDAKMKNPRLDTSFNYVYFTSELNPEKRSEGRDYLESASEIAIDFLGPHSPKGYFLMIEGSQIDWAGHKEDPYYLMQEMKEFDKVIEKTLDYAIKDGETLVIVTADHETGGLSLSKGNLNGKIKMDYTQNLHTGTMVPVFAYGPGANLFNGVYDNTDIFKKIKELLNRSE